MTAGMIIMTIIAILWLICGACGLWNCDKDKVNYCLIIFFFFTPFLAIIGSILLK